MEIRLYSFIHVASKLYGVNATIIIFVFVLYCTHSFTRNNNDLSEKVEYLKLFFYFFNLRNTSSTE